MPDAGRPREYDRAYLRPLSGPLRVRIGYDRNGAVVTRFLVQLEDRYHAEWHVVARYDHDARGSDESVHDVTEEGLHVDIYRDGRKETTEFIVGPLPASRGFDLAEDHLAQNLQRYVERFERWHEIGGQDR